MGSAKSKGHRGINIRKYCAEHEAYVDRCLSDADDPDALLALHTRKLGWLQHERLIHLIVTLIVSMVFLFSIWLFIVLGNPLVFILIAIVFVLLGAYIRHYFFLENKVQYWYALCDRIDEKRE